jgi:hypothetical protein
MRRHAVRQLAILRLGSTWPFSHAGKTKCSGRHSENRSAQYCRATRVGCVRGMGRPSPAVVLLSGERDAEVHCEQQPHLGLGEGPHGLRRWLQNLQVKDALPQP